jgi:hypothetical protein
MPDNTGDKGGKDSGGKGGGTGKTGKDPDQLPTPKQPADTGSK